MLFIFLFTFFSIFLIVQGSEFSSKCPERWDFYPDLHLCLVVPHKPRTWIDAKDYCASNSAELATVRNEDEFRIITDLVERENPQFLTWTALRKNENETDFSWIDGTVVNESYWETGRIRSPNHDCGAINSDNKLKGLATLDCDNVQFFICQKEAYGNPPEILVGPNGTITSPRWPQTYPSNLEHYQIIQLNEAEKIKLTIEEFETESQLDILTLHDGKSSQSMKLLRLSGKRPEQRTLTSKNMMLLHFSTNRNTEMSGYRLSYEAWIPPSEIIVESRESFSRLSSANYPNGYNFTRQRYSIECPNDRAVSLQILDVNLQENDGIFLFPVINGSPKIRNRISGLAANLPRVLNYQMSKVILRFDGFNCGPTNSGWLLLHRCEQKEIEIPRG
ncbi:unnamed protein product, partial [Mesorhabditis belari]|uniref:C-type lectin domain-containing protein n=1 Tax=Mesorhabditis belari TaxID=2138241 RepID=A0AAF3FD79_9BILA